MMMLLTFDLQERLSHGISASGFPGNHRAADFQHHHPYFPPHFPTGVSQHQTAQDFVAAQNAHLAATDPYNVNSLHHSFQTTQVCLTFKFDLYNYIGGIILKLEI